MKARNFIKKITLTISLLFCLIWSVNAQDYCSQYETRYIDDNASSFSINISDITCNNGYPIENIDFSFYINGTNYNTGNSSNCDQAFSIIYNLDGDITTGNCTPYLYSYSFNNLTITVNDLDGELDDVYIDVDMFISYFPPCIVPSNLTATNLTPTGATLSLTEDGSASTWNWYITPNSWDIPDYYNQTLYTFSETVVWNGGTEGTTYYAYGRSECGFDYEYGRSDYVGPIIFTLCANNNAVSASESIIANGNSTNINIANTTIGTNYTLRNDSNNAIIGTPVAGNGGTVSLNTGAIFNTTTFNVYAEDTLNASCTTELAQTVTVAISACLDPSVANPTNPTATNITTTGATLSLTENGTVTNWDWYIAPTGATAPINTTIPSLNDISNPIIWSGGISNTTYDAYVRTDCNMDNIIVTSWVGPVTFSVLCMNDYVVTAENNAIEVGESTNIIIANSDLGVNYSLRNDATNMVIGSPIVGTGNAISFNTGILNNLTTFNILAEKQGLKDGALDLDGTDDYVVLPNTINNQINNNITLEGWFNIRQIDDAVMLIGESFLGDGKIKFLIGTTGSNIRAGFFNGGFTEALATKPSLNTWVHIATTYNQNTIKLYYNGVEVASTASTNNLPLGTEEWRLGRRWDNFNLMDGKMDEVRIWNVARTQAEIQASMNDCLVGTETGLVAYYSFEDGTGSSILTDNTGNGFNGALTNMNPNTDWITSALVCNNLTCSQELPETVTVYTCIEPINPTVNNISLNGATLGLTAVGSSTNWDWYIVPTSDPVPTIATTPTINDVSNATIWSGGSEDTTYDAYVRADCSGTNTNASIWVGPINFTTRLDCQNDYAEILGTPFDGVQYGTINYADVNNDNFQDVLITGKNSSNQIIAKLYLNNTNGSFTEELGTPFEGVQFGAVSFADIDGDNDQDVFITGRNTSGQKTAKLYINNAGVFSLDVSTSFPEIHISTVAFVDVDNDNDKDLIITGEKSGATSRIAKLYLNDGSGNFTEDLSVPFDGVRLGSIAIADVDNNGFKDVFITGENGLNNRIAKLYTNNAGVFTLKAGNTFDGVRRSSIAFFDANNDNKQDIIITGENSTNNRIAKLYTNDGTGIFTEIATNLVGVYLGAIATTDIDLDGDKEVVITGISNANLSIAKTYCNNGLGVFTELSTPFENVRDGAISFGDINNDSFEDLIITGKAGSGQRISKLYSNFVPCFSPANLTATNITINGADLNWSETGTATTWDIEIVTQGATHTGTPTSENVSKPFTFNTGQISTSYDYYVRADCSVGEDVSTWVGPFTFTTLSVCSIDDPSNLTANNITTSGADLNWTENGDTTNWDIEIGTQGFASTGNPTNENVTKPFTFNAGSQNNSYDFYVRADCDSNNGSLSNWVGPFTFTTLNCNTVLPSNLSAMNYSTTGADLDWSENGNASTWDLEIVAQGNAATGTPNFEDVSKPFTYSNGTEFSNYDFYVRSDCNADNTEVSAWAGPFNFTTLEEGVCGNGSFTEVMTPFEDLRYGSVAFADIDNDNDQDVLITGDRPGNLRTASLYKNDGSGNYTLVTGTPFEGVRSSAIAFADVDNDNDQDVIITGQGYHPTNLDPNIAKMYLNDGSGNFTLATGTPFIGVFHSSIAFADIDNDNDMDVVITGDQEGGLNKITKLYRNNGAGIFTLETGTIFENVAHSSVVFADVDNDNDQDLVITGNNNIGPRISKLYLNNGTGIYTEDTSNIFEGVNLGSTAIADIDNDNDQDIFITGRNNANQRIAKLYTNDGTGNFTEVVGTPFDGIFYNSIAFSDFDNDNDPDVLITGLNSANQKITKLYANDGSGTFREVFGTPFEGVYRGSMAFADIDNDNDQDVLITGLNQAEQKTTRLFKTSPAISETKYTASGWTNGLPTINKCVVIDHDYITTSFSALTTTINVNKTLTIAASTYLEVQGNILNNGNLTIEPTGSVVQIDNTATVTGLGTFSTKVNTTSLIDADRFTYFSSPSSSETLDVFNLWGKMNRLYYYDDSIQDWSLTNYIDVMTAGKGFAIQPDASNIFPITAQTVFGGAFNNGVITKSLFFDVYNNITANYPDPAASDDDSNFVGNPYPSALSADDLINNNNIDTILIWTHDSVLLGSGDYANDDYINCVIGTCTNAASAGPNSAHNGLISTGQGFFVTATATSNLVFNNAMRRKNGNDQFRATTSKPKLWLDMTSSFGYGKQIAFTFTEHGSVDFDQKYESKITGNTYGLGFYSFNNQNDKLTINDSGDFNNELTIPLGYYINSENVNAVTIKINHFENMEDINIYLKDNLLNVVHDLKQTNYQIPINIIGENNNRFEIIFNRDALSINEQTLTNNLIVSNQDENHILVKINNGNALVNVKIYDLLGKLIINTKVNSESIMLPTNVNQGTVLFIKATLTNGVVLHKKFIKM